MTKFLTQTSLGKRFTPETSELPKLIFFDTSIEEEDININQKLIELIGEITDVTFLILTFALKFLRDLKLVSLSLVEKKLMLLYRLSWLLGTCMYGRSWKKELEILR